MLGEVGQEGYGRVLWGTARRVKAGTGKAWQDRYVKDRSGKLRCCWVRCGKYLSAKKGAKDGLPVENRLF